jgi:hypothetical protein
MPAEWFTILAPLGALFGSILGGFCGLALGTTQKHPVDTVEVINERR